MKINESKEQKFIKLAVRSIEAQAITLPFALNTVIEVNIILPPDSFDLFYSAFEDRAIFVLTVVDIKCVFEGLIMEIHRNNDIVDPAGWVGCQMRISSIYRIIFDNSITEQGVIQQLEYESIKTNNPDLDLAETTQRADIDQKGGDMSS